MARRKPPISIVESHPAYSEWAARRDELQDRLAHVLAQGAKMRAEADQRAAVHQAAVRAAVESRGDVPRQPEVIDFRALDEAGQLVRQDIAAHVAKEADVLAAVAADGGTAAAHDRLKVTTTNIAEPLALVEDALRDLRVTIGVLAKLIRAADAAEGVTPSRAAAALDQRGATLTLDDLALAVRNGLAIEESAVRVEDVVREVTRVSPQDEENAKATRERVEQELRRRDAAAWSNRRGLVVELDQHGAFATGSPNQAGRTPLGHRG